MTNQEVISLVLLVAYFAFGVGAFREPFVIGWQMLPERRLMVLGAYLVGITNPFLRLAFEFPVKVRMIQRAKEMTMERPESD